MTHLPEETHFSNSMDASMFYEMKQCSKCGEKKPLREFNNRQASRDGKQSYCRLCQEDDRLLRAYNLTRQQSLIWISFVRKSCTGSSCITTRTGKPVQPRHCHAKTEVSPMRKRMSI